MVASPPAPTCRAQPVPLAIGHWPYQHRHVHVHRSRNPKKGVFLGCTNALNTCRPPSCFCWPNEPVRRTAYPSGPDPGTTHSVSRTTLDEISTTNCDERASPHPSCSFRFILRRQLAASPSVASSFALALPSFCVLLLTPALFHLGSCGSLQGTVSGINFRLQVHTHTHDHEYMVIMVMHTVHGSCY